MKYMDFMRKSRRNGMKTDSNIPFLSCLLFQIYHKILTKQLGLRDTLLV